MRPADWLGIAMLLLALAGEAEISQAWGPDPQFVLERAAARMTGEAP